MIILTDLKIVAASKDEIRVFVLVLFLFSLLTSASTRAHAQSRVKPAPIGKPASAKATQVRARPSLDALLERATAYWNLLAQGKKLQAMQYVEPACREYFAERPFPRFSSPRITRLEPGASGPEVAVTATVKRRLPNMPSEMDYPVSNQWIFSRGSWWVIVKEEPVPFGGLPSANPVGKISTEELAKRRAYVNSNLRFSRNEIDLGTVRKGTWAEFEIDYQWSADEPVDARFAPASLSLVGFEGRKLVPGTDQRIPLRLETSDMDGEIKESLVLHVQYQGIDVPYEFKLRGRVYTPLSVVPPVLRFRAGEKEKDFEVVNNSSSEAVLDSVFANNAGLEVQTIPQRIAPGARCTLKITLKPRQIEKNQGEEVTIKLEQPVDQLIELIVPVVLNYEEPVRRNFGNLTAKDIEDLLKKAPPTPIKP